MPSTPLTISSGRQPWASGQMAGGASWTLVGEKLIGWWCVCTGLCVETHRVLAQGRLWVRWCV